MWEPTGQHDKNAAGSERSPQESAMDGEDGAHTHAESADGEHLVVLVVVALAHRRLGPSSSDDLDHGAGAAVLGGPSRNRVGPRPLGCRAEDESHFISIT
jgi:hypothetical protein